jgi:hypothetical protein
MSRTGQPEGAWSFFLSHATIFVFCLLVAHYVMIYELSLSAVQMNIAYVIIALPFGFDFFIFFRARLGSALLVGALLGSIVVLGMSTVVWLSFGSPFLPDDPRSKRDVAETVLAVMCAYAAGNALAAAIYQLLPEAFAAPNDSFVLTIKNILLAVRAAFEGRTIERINGVQAIIKALTSLVLAVGGLWLAVTHIFTK